MSTKKASKKPPADEMREEYDLRGGVRGKFFAGTWHAWRKEKAARELALGRAIEKQEAEIARLERFVDRFRAGTRARQAQARVKQLEKIQRLERDPRDGKALGFAFKPPERSGRVSTANTSSPRRRRTAAKSVPTKPWPTTSTRPVAIRRAPRRTHASGSA